MHNKRTVSGFSSLLLLTFLMLNVQGLMFPAIAAPVSEITVSGTVSDEMGPMMGVTLVQKSDGNNGVVTDMDGRFTITVPEQSIVTVSFMGYETQEFKAVSNHIDIVLKEDNTSLDEVVIIGYGSMRKETVTGSVANINGDKINQVASSNLAEAIQGRVAGVDMQQTSSRPGADMQIRIRGQRSLNASNDPLIVLDGIPFIGSLSDISPNDIKSMDILKDASATAIYGSRGANGVIIITTVRGSEGSPAKFSYNGYVSLKKVFHKYPMMNTETYMKMREYADEYSNTLYEDVNNDTDWQDLFYRDGYTHSHDLSVNGGTKGGSYSFGIGYYDDASVIPTQGFERISIRGNIDQSVGKWLKFGLGTNSSYRSTTGNNIGLYDILQMTPMTSPFDADGNPQRTVDMPADAGKFVWTRDILESLSDRYLNEEKGVSSYNNMYAEVKCPWIEGLSYKASLGLNFRSMKNGAFTGTGIGSSNASNPNKASVKQTFMRHWVMEHLLTYDRFFNGKHHLNITGLYSKEETTFEQTYMSGQNIPAEYFQYYQIGAAKSDLAIDPGMQNYWQSGLVSWMGRAIYTYDDRYMASVAFRSDASSRLAKGHQWHTYPAISVGWNLGNESFMKRFEWLDNLKIRVGFGETSNQSIDPYSTLGALSTTYYNHGSNMMTGYYVSTLPNPELGWEYSTTWNYGIDWSMFGGRLYGTIEYYSQNTHDLLLSVNLPPTSGVGSYMANVGKTRNRGFELSLNGVIIDNRNGWTWDAGLNLYANRNKLMELASGADRDVSNRWFVGYPIDVIYDYNRIGLWQEDEQELLDILEPGGNPGMIKVEYTGEYDENGLPVRQINSEDMQIRSMEPDLMGGFNTSVSYRNFDLSLIAAFQIGGTLISTIHSSNGYLNMLSGRRGQLDVDYWTPENTDAKYPKPGGIKDGDNPMYGSTLGYFDASYLKIRTITLGYNFEKLKTLRNLGISRLRLYCTVQNPFVLFSPYTRECGLDPETNTTSKSTGTMATSMEGYTGSHTIPVIGYNTPSTRTFIFGVNFSF